MLLKNRTSSCVRWEPTWNSIWSQSLHLFKQLTQYCVARTMRRSRTRVNRKRGEHNRRFRYGLRSSRHPRRRRCAAVRTEQSAIGKSSSSNRPFCLRKPARSTKPAPTGRATPAHRRCRPFGDNPWRPTIQGTSHCGHLIRSERRPLQATSAQQATDHAGHSHVERPPPRVVRIRIKD